MKDSSLTIKTDMPFEYGFSHKGSILVVTFSGPMNLRSVKLLSQCREELKSFSSVQKTILYFNNVSVISGEAIQLLTHIQLDVRSRRSELRICSLHEEVKSKLQKMGVVRYHELTDTLALAIRGEDAA